MYIRWENVYLLPTCKSTDIRGTALHFVNRVAHDGCASSIFVIAASRVASSGVGNWMGDSEGGVGVKGEAIGNRHEVERGWEQDPGRSTQQRAGDMVVMIVTPFSRGRMGRDVYSSALNSFSFSC